MTINIKKIDYHNWQNCYSVSDGVVEAIVTSDFGPRIIKCGFVDGANLFGEIPDFPIIDRVPEWRIYGGHRFWHSPESWDRTYFPDNEPLQITPTANGLQITQPVETNTGIQKRIIISLNDQHIFTVEHQFTNHGLWTIELAPWPLSVMSTGGTAIIPQPREGDPDGFIPSRIISVWPYAKMNDPRVTLGENYIFVKQDPNNETRFKFGITVPDGWLAYLNYGNLFVKQFSFINNAPYPDGGVNAAIFTNKYFLELESLGPLTKMAPNDTLSFTERWSLHKTDLTTVTEETVEQTILPLIKKLQP